MAQICTDRPFRSMINRLIANCCFTRGPNYQRHPAAKMSTIVERHCLSSILNLYSLCYLMFRLCRRNVTLCRLFMIIYLCQQIIVYLVYIMILCVLVDVLRHFLLFHHVSSCFMTFHHCTFWTWLSTRYRSSNSVHFFRPRGEVFQHQQPLGGPGRLEAWVPTERRGAPFARHEAHWRMDGDGVFFTGKCLVFGGKYMFLWGSYITLSTVQVFGKIMSCGVFMRRCSCFFVTQLLCHYWSQSITRQGATSGLHRDHSVPAVAKYLARPHHTP